MNKLRRIGPFHFTAFISLHEGIQQIEKRSEEIHLSIVCRFEKAYILLLRVTRKLQMIRHKSILNARNTVQIQKSFPKGLINLILV